MTPKEYMLQYKLMKIWIKNLEEIIDNLRAEQDHVTSDMDGMPRGSDISDRTGELATQLADIGMTLISMRAEAWRICIDIVNTISKVKEPEYVRLLHLRYIEMKTWDEISSEMHYSYQWVCTSLHSRALSEVGEILDRKKSNS